MTTSNNNVHIFIGNVTTNTTTEEKKVEEGTDDTKLVRNISSMNDIGNELSKSSSSSVINELHIFINENDISSLYNPMSLSDCVSYLNSEESSQLFIHVSSSSSNKSLQPIHTSFLLAGLICTSEKIGDNNERVLIAKRKPKKDANKNVAKVMSLHKKTNNNIVSINLDGDDDDDDLIDEDDLLGGEGSDNILKPPPSMSQAAASNTDDCGGRQPCDNCTCGRADEMNKTKQDNAQKQIPKSDCGKCGLGDAFRCASCPYLGKPAFKPGEEHLVLELTDDL